MSEQKTVTPHVTGKRFSRIAISVGGHLLATTTLFAAFSSFFFTEQSFGLLKVGLGNELMRPDIVGPAVLLFGLAGCAWAMTFIVYQLVKTRAQEPKTISLKKARGTVITETLIVFPVFLMLSFGLAQMALTSIAGILTTLASYEATRTLAVWAVEEDNNRAPGGTVTRAHIRERARLAAALVIAPATPELQLDQPCASNALALMTAGMAAAGLEPATAFTTAPVESLAQGFGETTFRQRGPTKLYRAFCATDVLWTNVDSSPTTTGRSQFTATVRYHHPMVMPALGFLFARDFNAGPWVTNNVTTIERNYRLTTYLTPNTWLPFHHSWYAP